ncbi:MAG: glycosyltransferase family 4 protein [Sphingomonas sp.]|nr:glycosyltransferase family 4 protein [Sphingomonas sp.]
MPLIAVAANNAWNIVNYRSGLIGALKGAGCEVAVIPPDGPYSEAVRSLGASFYSLPMQPRGRSPVADLALLMRYRRLLRRLRPDAFLGFTAKPNIWGSLAARSMGIQVSANISGLGAVFARRGPLMRLVAALYRRTLKAPAVVLFQNPDDRALFVARKIVTQAQTRLLPGSGVDLAHFAPRAVKSSRGKRFTFLFAGRLWAKGVAEFVEAGQLLKGQGLDVSMQILGMVEPQGQSAVPSSALEQWQEEGPATFLGSTDDVRSAVAQADCVVLPSYYGEGVPHILLEAAAMARPVITTNTAGCRLAVDDGVSGYKCQAGSMESLAAAMSRMALLKPAALEAMGQWGRAKMEREFDQEFVHASYLAALGLSGIL